MPTSRAKRRADAFTAEDAVAAWQKNPQGDTEGEDNSHLPPLPLPTTTTPRSIDTETGRVKWTVEELAPPIEEPDEGEEAGPSGEGPEPSLGEA